MHLPWELWDHILALLLTEAVPRRVTTVEASVYLGGVAGANVTHLSSTWSGPRGLDVCPGRAGPTLYVVSGGNTVSLASRAVFSSWWS